ncbi:radical SAM family heme chaperone HemW [Selenomonas sp. KH1T6]|uniref:radical SAM family heme chaperone HemW n=1 Tax=Selenomonas sp. KH1T6 TaxID=3158784 RepID=UPI0008A7F012|nr:oxygen-independent coproporphyrinogen-3 oxidase [Selenomonas ruminantium]
MQWGVYVHIPFCKRKCNYCDFASYGGREEAREAYVDALGVETLVRGQEMVLKHGRPATLYMGGGTPTALTLEQMGTVMALMKSVFGEPEEFTVEVNPGTVDEEYLKKLREWGANRLSIGVQSFDDDIIKRLGRIHTAAQAEETIRAAREAGFENLSLDLMYGLPGQTMEILKDSVEKALELAPQHISIYGLQVEEGTPFYRDQQEEKLALPPEADTEAMYDYMTEFLPEKGWRRYEISNFAKPGLESKHNLSYWQDVPYLGLGAAAHSYLDGMRLENVADLDEYINTIKSGSLPLRSEEEPSEQHHMEEFAFLALRTAKGIDKKKFKETFGRDLRSVYGKKINRLVREGLLQENKKSISLTKAGAKVGNQVFAEFLL